jgi:DNA-directed RNA polymerase subunit RPC12/RpoP
MSYCDDCFDDTKRWKTGIYRVTYTCEECGKKLVDREDEVDEGSNERIIVKVTEEEVKQRLRGAEVPSNKFKEVIDRYALAMENSVEDNLHAYIEEYGGRNS